MKINTSAVIVATPPKHANLTTNTPALLSLVFGILGWLVLPIIGPLAAVVAGHMGWRRAQAGAPRGSMAMAGMILGYLALVGTVLLVTLAWPAYRHYVALSGLHVEQPAKPAADMSEPVSAPADGLPTAALDMAKIWVQARVTKGIPLNTINEPLPLDAEQKHYWQSIDIRQGSVYALPVSADVPLMLMSVQMGQKIEWACAGQIPDFVQRFCTQS